MRPDTTPIAAHRPPHVEPQYRRELVPVGPAARRVDTRITRTALEHPGDAGLIASLRLCGVRRVHGIFDASAWGTTCTAAGLFRLPLAGPVRADMSRIMERARQQWQSDWTTGGNSPEHYALRIMAEMPHASLLHEIFPGGEPCGATPFEVDFPRPPRELLPVLQRAGLAGLDCRVAVPAGAIRLPEIDALRARWAASPRIDPIVYGTHSATGRVAVLGFYGATSHDPEALKSLVAVLESLAIDL